MKCCNAGSRIGVQNDTHLKWVLSPQYNPTVKSLLIDHAYYRIKAMNQKRIKQYG